MSKKQPRVFVAVELSPDTRDAISDWVQAVRRKDDGVRWLAPRSFHLTLRFLGETDAGQIPTLAEALQTSLEELPAFPIDWVRIVPFPPRRRPLVVALEPEQSGPLMELAAAVEQVVVGCGFPVEKRCFTPHLTVGRLRRRGGPPPTTLSADSSRRIPMRVQQTALFSSELLPTGAEYSVLARFAHPS
jgi:2'-5' RNA ligase